MFGRGGRLWSPWHVHVLPLLQLLQRWAGITVIPAQRYMIQQNMVLRKFLRPAVWIVNITPYVAPPHR